MAMHHCAICGRRVDSYGLKFLRDKQDHKICRKGVCRHVYDDTRDIDEAKAMFKWGVEKGNIVWKTLYGQKHPAWRKTK
jgi:hypothetical protein